MKKLTSRQKLLFAVYGMLLGWGTADLSLTGMAQRRQSYYVFGASA